MSDTKHGWISPRTDGLRARCGGPEMCTTCNAEQEHRKMYDAAPPRQTTAPSAIPAGWKLVEKKTCYVLMHDEDVIATLAGPGSEENAAIIASMLAAPASPVSTVEQGDDDQVTAILWTIMRDAQAAKEPCSEDPESAAAIRNSKLASIAGAAAQALGLVKGPEYPAPAAGDAQDAARLNWLEQHDGRFFNKDRISSIVGVGFLVAGDPEGVRHQTVRSAIDAAIAAQRQGDA